MSQIMKSECAPMVREATREYVTPVVNIHQDADGYTLEVEVPGVPKSGVEVTYEDGKLTLIGRRSPVANAENLVYRETADSDYRRVFDLDPSIDASKIEAVVEQGVLTVRLPKAETARPRRISVA